ncbi:hypothetical protein K501DRAFT_304135 [Backusella circina FSU 941]|nr:hypothetical protein K501DRAFT_304135 [Backusella circina FSU 941]
MTYEGIHSHGEYKSIHLTKEQKRKVDAMVIRKPNIAAVEAVSGGAAKHFIGQSRRKLGIVPSRDFLGDFADIQKEYSNFIISAINKIMTRSATTNMDIKSNEEDFERFVSNLAHIKELSEKPYHRRQEKQKEKQRKTYSGISFPYEITFDNCKYRIYGKIYSTEERGSHFYAVSKINYKNTTILSKIDNLQGNITRITSNESDFEEHLTGCKFSKHNTPHSGYILITRYKRITDTL